MVVATGARSEGRRFMSNIAPVDQHLAALAGDDLVLTAAEAAQILRRSPRTLERMRQTGSGPRWFRLNDSPNAAAVYRLGDVKSWVRQRLCES